MRKQYLDMKEKYRDCILFFRLGDFYEMFDDDALLASRELDLTLTTRDRKAQNEEDKVPMCGIPYHSSEAYIARLIAKGYKVAICEQLEDPALAKGLVERDVIKIVTPGMVMDASMQEEGKSNYVSSVYKDDHGMAVCFAEISTGEISAISFPPDGTEHLLNELIRFSPAETVMNRASAEDKEIRDFLRQKIGALIQMDDWRFEFSSAEGLVCTQFNKDTKELHLDGENEAICAVGGLLSYIRETQKANLGHISRLDFYSEGKFMELDVTAVRNLEILATLRTMEKKGSLLWVLDKTKTPMGARLLRSWLSKPLMSVPEIKRRQNAVNVLVRNTMARSEAIGILRKIGDIERLIGKTVYGTAGARDLYAMGGFMENIPALAEEVGKLPEKGAMLTDIGTMDALTDVRELIGRAISDTPPFSVREGGMIRDGFDPEVDRLRHLLNNSTDALAAIEAKERERTGKKLKVGYNKVYGYYIEIPRSMSSDVPADYVRKQTLVNGERFITQELKNLETELLTAKDKLADLEFRIMNQVRESIASQVTRIQATTAKIASLDVLCALAETAAANNYCMPEVDLSGIIDIKDGRHPVVEAMQTDSMFVPNDVFIGTDDCTTAIITGPNMAGKSTYMRQTAIIVLLAQIGSFVPAKSARIGIVDRIFTRIGASDDLSAGKSTFMVEMSEVADILSSATERSLLILDEIGRGTSTYDGMSIARAVLEYCADKKKLGAKTLFATHYHELTVLEGELPGVRNFNISVKKRGDDIIFLRKIVPGGADESYGIEVAGLAGVPQSVIKRAKEILSSVESGNSVKPAKRPRRMGFEDTQVSMLDMSASEVTETLRKLNPDTLTPLEALNMLYELKKKVQN